jgi:chorismate-pyruvate lyase
MVCCTPFVCQVAAVPTGTASIPFAARQSRRRRGLVLLPAAATLLATFQARSVWPAMSMTGASAGRCSNRTQMTRSRPVIPAGQAPDTSTSRSPISALVTRHFLHASDPDSAVSDVSVLALDPTLRCLLFTDGTVTRTLEALTLAPVRVDLVEQSPSSLPTYVAASLNATVSDYCVRRRVTFNARTGAVSAESYILPERLPSAFLAALGQASRGIGGATESLGIESRRDLLSFGIGGTPSWAPASASCCESLVRRYRVVTNERPAVFISEAFAVTATAGCYRLSGQDVAPTGSDDTHRVPPDRGRAERPA